MAYYENYLPDENGVLHKVVINAGVGFVLPYYGETAPPGTLACDGSEISRAAYDELFAVLGTKAGAGDGETTFNLPDFRGDFIRGLGGDNAGGLGVEQSDAIRNITGEFTIRRRHSSPVIDDIAISSSGAFSLGNLTGAAGCVGSGTASSTCQTIAMQASAVVPTAAENRPINVALLWCIIYE